MTVAGFAEDLLFLEEDGSRVERVELDDGKDIAAFLRLNIEHVDEIFVREEVQPPVRPP